MEENYYKFKYLKYKNKYLQLKNENTYTFFNKIKHQIGGEGKNDIFNPIYNPIYIEEYNIYDICHNDINQIIIISPSEDKPLIIKLKHNNKLINFNLEICPHNHTYIYYSTFCKYKKEITLIINGNEKKVTVNKYPQFTNKIIMSTLVKNEDNYIIQWINYHIRLGIEKFIIYDNIKSNYVIKNNIKSLLLKQSNLEKVLQDYIEKKIVVLINWPYTYKLPISGISGQTTQQNHSIYSFRGCKYIGLFDIDEYINPQIDNLESNNLESELKNIQIDNIFNKIIKKNRLNINNIGSFVIKCKLFYNPDNKSTDGYNFLNIYNCDTITLKGREKNFVIPKNVRTFSVHQITKGKKSFTINFNILFFNHYFYLNKSDRGNYKTKYKDDSIKKIIKIINLNI